MHDSIPPIPAIIIASVLTLIFLILWLRERRQRRQANAVLQQQINEKSTVWAENGSGGWVRTGNAYIPGTATKIEEDDK